MEHDGKYFSFPRTTLVPKPVTKPHPELWIASQSAAGVRKVARRIRGFLHEADHCPVPDVDDAAFRRPRGPEDREGGEHSAGAVGLDEPGEVEVGEVVGVDDEEHVLARDEVPVGEQGARATEQHGLVAQPHRRGP